MPRSSFVLCLVGVGCIMACEGRSNPVSSEAPAASDDVSAVVAASAPYTAELMIESVGCASCSVTIRRELKQLEGIVEIREGKTKQHLLIDFDDRFISPERILEAVHTAGYDAELMVYSTKT